MFRIRVVYRRILDPACDNEKENWGNLTNKEIYARVKNPTVIQTIRLCRLRWFGHVQRMEGNIIPRRVLYRVIHKSFRDFRTRLRNNQDRHGRKEHINR